MRRILRIVRSGRVCLFAFSAFAALAPIPELFGMPAMQTLTLLLLLHSCCCCCYSTVVGNTKPPKTDGPPPSLPHVQSVAGGGGRNSEIGLSRPLFSLLLRHDFTLSVATTTTTVTPATTTTTTCISANPFRQLFHHLGAV